MTFPLRLVGGSDLWRQTIDIAGDLTQSAHPIHDIHPTFHQGVGAVTAQLHPDPGFTNNDVQLPFDNVDRSPESCCEIGRGMQCYHLPGFSLGYASWSGMEQFVLPRQHSPVP